MTRWSLLVVAALLLHCRGSQTERVGRHSEVPAAIANPTANQWSARAALKTCEDALNAALTRPPESRRANALMVTCSALVRGAACRQAMAKQLSRPGAAALRESLSACASEYCNRPNRNRLVACTTPLPAEEDGLRQAWVDLRLAMLVDDFAEPERPAAAALLSRAAQYVTEVPPPSVPPESLAPPSIKVQVDPDGSIVVEKAGAVLGTVASAAALSSLLPRCLEDDPVSLAVSSGLDHATVIVVMDELRSLGCGHISFAVRR
jgi:biopolymer transport protein ExbD